MSGEANQALELDELKALCAAATEGPWYQSPDAPWHVRTVLENALIPLALKDGEPIAAAVLDADAAFIAAARSAVPVLIAEVERLTQERDEARSALESVRDFAVAVERQNHHALVAAQDALDADGGATFHVLFDALTEVVRLLETENQQ